MGAVATGQPAQFLFAMWDGGGNVPPLLAIVHQLIARGHRVRVLAGPLPPLETSPSFLPALAAAGCSVVPFPPMRSHSMPVAPERGLLRGWTPAALGSSGLTHRRYAVCHAWADALVTELRHAPAAVVAADCMLPGALVGAEAVGVPAVSLMHSVYGYFHPAPGLPPRGLGFRQARGPAGRLRDAVGWWVVARVYRRDGLPALNAARATFGLPPLHTAFAQEDRAARVLVLTSPAFDFRARALPANVQYTGMPFADDATAVAWNPPWPADQRQPLILVSLSTTTMQQAAVIQRILQALTGLPVRGLVTLGPSVDPATFRAPVNVVLRSFVPHTTVLPQVAAVITHAGHGTVMAALAHGVPLICLPLGRDQPDVAARVVAAGAGVRLTADASSTQIRRALQQVLTTRGFAERARHMAAAITRENGARTAADALESVATGYPPVGNQGNVHV